MVARKEIEEMVVICPKCKVRLKVSEDRIGPEGTRFKCPKCTTILLVKRPVSHGRPLDAQKVVVAHEDLSIRERIKSVLEAAGYKVITASDGIEAMVQVARELPFLSVLSVSLPKIYGFEVAGRLKKRPETSGIKAILVASLYDVGRYRREPASLHGADAYIEEHRIEESLISKIVLLKGGASKGEEEAAKGEETERMSPGPTADETEAKKEAPGVTAKVGAGDDRIEKAKRLARTIVSDIYLYSRAKVEEAIRNDNFYTTFEAELREGIKLYESRIPADVRKIGDFFSEAVNNFIQARKREIQQNF